MDDLISRQAAIDELVKMLSYCFYADEEVLDEVETTLKELPSVQLGTNLAEVGTDCISRQAAIDLLDVLCQEHRYKIPGKIETYSQYNEAWQDALDRAEGAIFNLPSAQPDIIQCRNCKFASGDSRICMKFGHSPIGELDFCAWAERRTDE